MTESEASPLPGGADVYVITYDEEGNEERVLPIEIDSSVVDRSRDFGIGKGRWVIERLKHGPLIATESQLRTVNVASLGRAVAGNLYGTALYVDHSVPPIDEDVLDIDGRYRVEVQDSGVVAIVTERYPTQPAQTAQDIRDSLTRVTSAYDCQIVDVSFALPGGTTPEELHANWPEDEEWSAQFRAETAESIATTAHDVKVLVATDDTRSMATLMDGAAAVADFLNATKRGAPRR